jgi:hypothetical protein
MYIAKWEDNSQKKSSMFGSATLRSLNRIARKKNSKKQRH